MRHSFSRLGSALQKNCHQTILVCLTSQSLLLRKTIVQERVRGALKPAALTPLIPVSSSRRTQTDSLQESRRPRDQLLLSRSAGIPPACCPSPSSAPRAMVPAVLKLHQARAVPVVPPRVGHKQTVCRSLAALVISFYCRGLPASPPRAAHLYPPLHLALGTNRQSAEVSPPS